MLSWSLIIVARIVGLPRFPTANVLNCCQAKNDIGEVEAKLFIPVSATEPKTERKFTTPLILVRKAERDRFGPMILKFLNAHECPELQTILRGSGAF